MPSIGSIWRSMTITFGRRSSDSINASRSSPWAPPAASPSTSISGSLSRNASSPRRTTSWSSTTSTPMVSSGLGSISGPICLRWDVYPDDGAEAGCARDREPPADLGRTAAHRLQAEMTGIFAGRVESLSVVADLYDDVALPSLHLDERRRGAGMLDDIRERLPADSIELGFYAVRKRKARRRPSNFDRGDADRAQPRGVPGECRDQPVVHRIATQFENERAHLALHALGELRDRIEGFTDTPGGAGLLVHKGLLRRAGVQHRREQGLGDRVVQVASYPPPLLHGTFALVSACFGQVTGGSLALADNGTQEQRRQCRDGDVELRAERPMVDRLLEKWADIVGRYADRNRRRDRDREGGPGRPESKCRPDQRRKHHVCDRLFGRDRDDAERGHGRYQCGALPGANAPGSRHRVPSPCEQQWQDNQASGGVAEPPGAPELGGVHLIDDATGKHRKRASGRTDRRRDPKSHEHAPDLLDTVHGGVRSDDSTQEESAHDDLSHVARLLPHEAPNREGAVVEQKLPVDHDLAEQHAGPPPKSPQVEGRDAQSGGGPDRRH